MPNISHHCTYVIFVMHGQQKCEKHVNEWCSSVVVIFTWKYSSPLPHERINEELEGEKSTFKAESDSTIAWSDAASRGRFVPVPFPSSPPPSSPATSSPPPQLPWRPVATETGWQCSASRPAVARRELFGKVSPFMESALLIGFLLFRRMEEMQSVAF